MGRKIGVSWKGVRWRVTGGVGERWKKEGKRGCGIFINKLDGVVCGLMLFGPKFVTGLDLDLCFVYFGIGINVGSGLYFWPIYHKD